MQDAANFVQQHPWAIVVLAASGLLGGVVAAIQVVKWLGTRHAPSPNRTARSASADNAGVAIVGDASHTRIRTGERRK